MYYRWVNFWVIHERYNSEGTSVWARGFQGVWYPVSCTFCSPVTARRATVRKKWEWKYTNWESSGAHSTCPFLINYDCLLLWRGGWDFYLSFWTTAGSQKSRQWEGGRGEVEGGGGGGGEGGREKRGRSWRGGGGQRLRDTWGDSDRGLSDTDLRPQPNSWQSFSRLPTALSAS